MDCRGYGNPSLGEIPHTSRYRNTSLSRWTLIVPPRPAFLLTLTTSMTSNISYDRSPVRLAALGRHSPIWMFHVRDVGIITSACICNGR